MSTAQKWVGKVIKSGVAVLTLVTLYTFPRTVLNELNAVAAWTLDTLIGSDLDEVGKAEPRLRVKCSLDFCLLVGTQGRQKLTDDLVIRHVWFHSLALMFFAVINYEHTTLR